MIELFTQLASKELSMCIPHRTLVEIIYNCCIGVVLFLNHGMVILPPYIMFLSKEKSYRRDGHAYGHVFFCSTPHNDSSYHCKYGDAMYSEMDVINKFKE